MQIELSRRAFLKQATRSVLALNLCPRIDPGFGLRGLAREGDPLALPNQLLTMVNEERARGGLSALKLDELACKVAQKHAIEMAEHVFLSHWDRDGLKPYHRYSFAGGTEAIEENEGATNQGSPIPAEEIAPEVIGLHQRMYDESPPHDGHRRAILGAHHTHAGFGIACRGAHVRLSEIYLARYATIDPHPAVVKPRSRFIFAGRVLDPAYAVKSIDVFYETLPAKRDLPALLTPQPYGLWTIVKHCSSNFRRTIFTKMERAVQSNYQAAESFARRFTRPGETRGFIRLSCGFRRKRLATHFR